MIEPSVFSRIAFPFRAATNSASMWNLPDTSLHSRAKTLSPAPSRPPNAAATSHFRHVHGRYMPLPPGESALRRALRQVLRGPPLFAASPADSGVELLPLTVRPRRLPVQTCSAIRYRRGAGPGTCSAALQPTVRDDVWRTGRNGFRSATAQPDPLGRASCEGPRRSTRERRDRLEPAGCSIISRRRRRDPARQERIGWSRHSALASYCKTARMSDSLMINNSSPSTRTSEPA